MGETRRYLTFAQLVAQAAIRPRRAANASRVISITRDGYWFTLKWLYSPGDRSWQ